MDNGVVTAIVNPHGEYLYLRLEHSKQPVHFPIERRIPANTMVSVTVTDVNTGCRYCQRRNSLYPQPGHDCSRYGYGCSLRHTGSASAIASLGTAPYSCVDISRYFASDWSRYCQSGSRVIISYVTDIKGCTALGVAEIDAVDNLTAAYQLDITDCSSPNNVTAHLRMCLRRGSLRQMDYYLRRQYHHDDVVYTKSDHYFPQQACRCRSTDRYGRKRVCRYDHCALQWWSLPVSVWYKTITMPTVYTSLLL